MRKASSYGGHPAPDPGKAGGLTNLYTIVDTRTGSSKLSKYHNLTTYISSGFPVMPGGDILQSPDPLQLLYKIRYHPAGFKQGCILYIFIRFYVYLCIIR